MIGNLLIYKCLVHLPGANKTSFFFDLIRKNVMSLVGSRSRMADLAYKMMIFKSNCNNSSHGC